MAANFRSCSCGWIGQDSDRLWRKIRRPGISHEQEFQELCPICYREAKTELDFTRAVTILAGMSYGSRAGFIMQILSDPLDDSVRLIFSDWLLENGSEEESAALKHTVKLNAIRRQNPDGIDWVQD